MSFPGRTPTTNHIPQTLLTPNQDPAEQSSVLPVNIAENTLQSFTSTVNATITPTSTPNPEIASNIQTVALGVLPQAKRPLQDVLNEWAGNDRNRLVSVNKISTCIRNQNSTLDLSSLSLTSLPDIFDYQELQHLQTLNVFHNQLTALPASFSQLAALKTLYLTFNRLTALPASFSQLTALEKLHLSYNQLTTVPESISQLITLQELDLSDNELTSLPESIGRLTALETLDLSGNQLTALPESINQLTSLQNLFLFCNELTSLAESFGHLTALEILDLSRNQLTTLPQSFGYLTALQELILDDNQLTTLPESFSQLAALQSLTLGRNQLTALPNFLRALLPNLQVHDLPFSVNIESITEEIYRLAKLQPSEALKQLYANATNGDDGQKALLKAWLSRLKDTAPGRAKDVNFYKSITHILELASINAPFAETFWNVIADATTTCGDRVALSILDLDIARQLMTLDLQKHLQVADFLKRGVWTHDLLKEIAVDKALTLRVAGTHFDEIEVHLGYFIKLKEALNLPISMQEMLYFRCSELTENDLEAAKTHVLGKISNEDAFVNFLIGQDQWKKTLKIKHPEALEVLEEAYAESDDPDVALETYQTALKDLTKQLLIEPKTKPIASIKRARVGTRELKELGINPNSQVAPEDEVDGRRKTRSSTRNS